MAETLSYWKLWEGRFQLNVGRGRLCGFTVQSPDLISSPPNSSPGSVPEKLSDLRH